MAPRFKTFVKNFGVFIAALLTVLGWAVTSGWTTVDHRYVHRDSFAIYQQGASEQRRDDSLVTAVSIVEVLHVVKGIDSTQKCDHGHREYCK